MKRKESFNLLLLEGLIDYETDLYFMYFQFIGATFVENFRDI